MDLKRITIIIEIYNGKMKKLIKTSFFFLYIFLLQIGEYFLLVAKDI